MTVCDLLFFSLMVSRYIYFQMKMRFGINYYTYKGDYQEEKTIYFHIDQNFR